jgi:ABC-type multidrug transport system ATPase subunit
MEINVKNIGKKYLNEWIFKGLTFNFKPNTIYAIAGANGSGKSTLLQVLCGFQPQTEGELIYSNQQIEQSLDSIYTQIAYASPSLELIEEYTLSETIQLHKKLGYLSVDETTFLTNIGLVKHKNKSLKYFSSGMRQRVKLGLCFYSNKHIIFLDEPTVNLDQTSKNWYKEQIDQIKVNKLIIIASNDPFEYSMAKEEISIENYKK